MKKMIFFFVCVLALAGTVILQHNVFQRSVTNLSDNISALETLVYESEDDVNTDKINEAFQKTLNDWHDDKKTLVLVVDYMQIEEVGISLAKIEIGIKKNNVEKCEEEINVLKNVCDVLKKREAMNWQNVL